MNRSRALRRFIASVDRYRLSNAVRKVANDTLSLSFIVLYQLPALSQSRTAKSARFRSSVVMFFYSTYRSNDLINANASSVDLPENDGGGTLMKSIDAAADASPAVDMAAAAEVVVGGGSGTAAGGDDDSTSTSMLTAGSS